jgi:hypothetical protein
MPDVATAVRVIAALALKAASREAVCRQQPQEGVAPLQPCWDGRTATTPRINPLLRRLDNRDMY